MWVSNHSIPPDGLRGLAVLRRLKSLLSFPVEPSVAAPNLHRAWMHDDLPAGLCVLVVDDNPVNRMLASEMLSYLGVKSLLAADGAEAVAMTTELRIGLILMDLQMPVLDGMAATQQIRNMERLEGRPRVPVVAYTSSNGHAQQLQSNLQSHGIDDLLHKPCDMAVLRDCLLRWCTPCSTLAQGPLAQSAADRSAQT